MSRQSGAGLVFITARVVILDIRFMPRYSFFKRGLSQPGVGGRGPVVPIGDEGSVDHAGDGTVKISIGRWCSVKERRNLDTQVD